MAPEILSCCEKMMRSTPSATRQRDWAQRRPRMPANLLPRSDAMPPDDRAKRFIQPKSDA